MEVFPEASDSVLAEQNIRACKAESQQEAADGNSAKSSRGSCSGGPAPGPPHSFHYRPSGDETGHRSDLVRHDPGGRKPALGSSAPPGGGLAQEEAEPASSRVGSP